MIEKTPILSQDGKPTKCTAFRSLLHRHHGRQCRASGFVLGTQTDLTVCEPNDIFAECMLAGGKLYGYSAQAAGDAVVARFDLEDVRRLADADRTIERAVMQLMAEHFLSAMDCIAGDRSQTASQRLANYLLSRCTLQATSQIIELPFQKRLLAGKLGLAPEALSRAFATLRCAGVSVHGKTIRVDDVTALRRV
ncbi:Crp/Fnr family transcriptional regulator [Rhizobium jaguaris]|uniref:Crp/Fnr family transcriptional regulator n=1 Tax=Rhizobium jaguaris TaxID=1312183 RepID=UPI0013C4C522|nr:helix-turn-helix domain-containing protein [Rhizobium jaguaris]